MTPRERMSSVDTAWLRMDRPANLMMIVGVLMLDSRLDLARLRRLVAARLLDYRRFRQRAEQDANGSYWIDDHGFKIERHVTRTKLAGSGGADADALKSLVADLASRPLDPAHPMWELALVEYDRRSAVIARFHHAYADGIALIGVLLSLTDTQPDAPPAPRARRTKSKIKSIGSTDDRPLQQLLAPIVDAIGFAARTSGAALEKSLDAIRHPGKALDYARIGAALATEVAALVAMPDDSPTRFKGKPGISKRVAWSEPVPLDDVKAAGRALGASVNDVLLSCVAGALGSYLRTCGDSTVDVELRALVPVNLRAPQRAGELGNRFGLVALVLPVGIVNPIERLHEVHRRMEALKRSYQAPVTMGVLGLVGMAPKAVQDQVLDLLASKATAVMTNVPGPATALYLAGARLANMMFWVPQSGDIGMGVSILSYAGSVQFGVITDAGLTPDPEAIIDGFRPELERLILALLMEPWDSPRHPAAIEAELALAAARL